MSRSVLVTGASKGIGRAIARVGVCAFFPKPAFFAYRILFGNDAQSLPRVFLF